MRTDWHNHVIAQIDDGADSMDTSLQMLEQMKEQGIERVIATPHFYAHREKSVEDFITKRNGKLDQMIAAESPIKNIILGAEVALERGVSDIPGIDKLAITGTRLILLELPYAPYKSWMEEEIYNITALYDLRPMIAHVHRYSQWYSKEEIQNVLGFDAIFQINAEAYESFQQKRMVKGIFKDKEFVFGSDCHNLSDRKPNFDLLMRKCKQEMLEASDGIFERYLK